MTKHVFLTGAGGFVGSHVLRRILSDTDWRVTCPVTLRHHGNSDRFAPYLADRPDWAARVRTFLCDLSCPIPPTSVAEIGPVDYILNIASESHVDRSISEPAPFIRNNVELMLNMLEFARQAQPKVFLHMGTDEEYGPAYGDYMHREWDTVLPSNPYSASKAAQSALATSWWRTYQVPVMLTRTMNLISPGQDREKYIPRVIRKVLAEEVVQIHASPEGIPGSRHWIDAREFAGAWLHLLEHAAVQRHPECDRPTMYHVVGEERSNLEIAQAIADILGKPLKCELVSFHSSRPGHDLRYALDGAKLASLGWTPRRPMDETLRDIVQWYLDRPAWLQ
ncbi:NAD-dependent epimerase/dehydratase family protein [Streptomyces microflavus]|uniref:NAD-dependent epimerase/dehydratase family protein n=1 Tax=Streptomyces microflavus TaxID=1919 RepID=UPI002E36F5A6|nr:NAD-dependent epimerase/dehydratase family protein [Streptomyces microflavus]